MKVVGFDVWTAEEFTQLDIPQTPLILPDLLDKQGKMLLAGGTGLGKSHLTLQMLYDGSQGKDIWSTYPITHEVNALYVQVEVSPFRLQKRVKRLESVLGPSEHLIIHTPVDFPLVEQEERLIDLIKLCKIELVAYDPWYMMHGGGELSLEQVLPTLRSINKVAWETGVATIIVAHEKKSTWTKEGSKVNLGADAISGHRALQNWPDTIGLVEGTPDGLEVEWVKNRNHEGRIPPLRMVWTDALPLAAKGSTYSKAQTAGPRANIFRLLASQETATYADMIKITGLSRGAAEKLVAGLVEEGMLQEVGRRGITKVYKLI